MLFVKEDNGSSRVDIDYSSEIAELKEQVTQLNGKSIIESSSNGNGNYIKFGDGTLLMWGIYKGNAWITNNNAPPYYSNDIEIALPMESIAPVTYSANVVSNGVIWNCGATYQQKKTIGIRLVGVTPYSNQPVSINWIACGRWM